MSQTVEMFILEQIRHANLMKINSNTGVQTSVVNITQNEILYMVRNKTEFTMK
jgi:hypothetical protein